MKYNIALVGATGMVGRAFLTVLAEKNLPVEKYYLFASARSAGNKVEFLGREYEIIELKEENIKDKEIDFTLFSAGGSVSAEYAPIFARYGSIVVDNSSFWRMNENVPLVVPEVNSGVIERHHKIISNPNCSTIQAVVVLAPLHKKFGIKRIVFSTYQAVSGAGKQGYDDLVEGEKGNFPKKFPHQIYNNIIPHIDAFMPDAYTKEEHKMIDETRKILSAPNMRITATAVRVPVLNSHSESINVEFEKKCTLTEVFETLLNAEGVVVLDDTQKNVYPMPIVSNGKDEVFVGRIRIDDSVESGINLWLVADNIRKGAATNAVQIVEYLIKKKNLEKEYDF